MNFYLNESSYVYHQDYNLLWICIYQKDKSPLLEKLVPEVVNKEEIFMKNENKKKILEEKSGDDEILYNDRVEDNANYSYN